MKVAKFVPSACKGENPSLEGFVVLKVPNFDEGYSFYDVLDMSLADDGKVIRGEKPLLKKTRDMVKAIKPFVIEVELTVKKSGELVKSYDEMTDTPECHPTLIEIAGVYAKGFDLGNG